MKPTILIVDDDANTRLLLESFAISEGYQPLLAADGEIALALLDGEVADLILLDAVMPGLDGFETCRRIKLLERVAHVPVIFMTGLTDTEHVVRGLDAGGVDYVTKPLILDELAARIRVHLGNARATRSAISGLDSVGARLVTCDADGTIRWATPEAQRMLDLQAAETHEALRSGLRDIVATGVQTGGPFGSNETRYSISLLGPAGPGEYLVKLVRSTEGLEAQLLQEAFGLTPREADVLLWTARGKSNKDMSEILNISARTVNKHLEQIFIKMGVENRASAATAAVKVLLET